MASSHPSFFSPPYVTKYLPCRDRLGPNSFSTIRCFELIRSLDLRVVSPPILPFSFATSLQAELSVFVYSILDDVFS